MDNMKLKGCPFCGNQPDIWTSGYSSTRSNGNASWYIECNHEDCFFNPRMSVRWSRKEGKPNDRIKAIIAAWNRAKGVK